MSRYSTTLLKPLFGDPDHWKLAINRAVVPLSGMPLTANNIPFLEWQIGLGFYDGSTYTTILSYVPQYRQNGAYARSGNSYNMAATSMDVISGDLTNYVVKSTYATLGRDNSIYPTHDNFGTGTYYYYTTTQTIEAYSLGNVLLNTFTIPGPYSLITFMYADQKTGNLFVGFNDPSGAAVVQYNRLTGSTWSAGVTYASPAIGTYAQAIAVCNDYLVIWWNMNVYPFTVTINSYAIGNTTSVKQTTVGLGQLDASVVVSGDIYYIGLRFTKAIFKFQVADDGTNTVISRWDYGTTTMYVYGLDQEGDLLANINGTYSALLTTNGTTKYTYVPTGGSFLSFGNGFPDQGAYNIWSYQGYLNAINTAFSDCFTDIKATIGGPYQPTQAPFLFYNSETGLFGLNCEGFYITTGTYQIYFNVALSNIFDFPSVLSPDVNHPTFSQLMIINYGINAIVGTGTLAAPQFINMYQESGTRQNLFDLNRIMFSTTRIPVSGDAEAPTYDQNGTSSNSSINLITDIVPDTSTLDNTATIIYLPNGVLRWYNLYAQQPFTILDVQIYYETKDGVIRSLPILNGNNFSCKIEFKKDAYEM